MLLGYHFHQCFVVSVVACAVCALDSTLPGDQVRFSDRHALKPSLITRWPDRDTALSCPRRKNAHALHGERIYFFFLYLFPLLCGTV